MSESLATRATEVLNRCKYPGYTWLVTDRYIQGLYYDSDVHTGLIAQQHTRKWLLSPHMTDSEIVQTALKLVLTSREHDARERFTYRGQRVFSPHYDVEDLVALCERGQADAGGRS